MEIALEQPIHVQQGNASVAPMICAYEFGIATLGITLGEDVPLGNALIYDYCY